MRSPSLLARVGLLGVALASTLSAGCGGRAAEAPLLGEAHGRSVSSPLRLRWLSSQRETGDLPSAIPLGGRSAGRVLVYLEFPEPEPGRSLLDAQLLLTSFAGVGSQAVDVELSRATVARPELRSWSDQPRALYPRLAARVLPQAWPARIDVTELVRAPRKPGEPLRLLLRAEPTDGESLLLATGASSGDAPQLDLYYR